MTWKILQGDAFHMSLSDNSVDAIVTDPPYGWEFMGKQWDKITFPKPGNLGGFADGNKPSFERAKKYLPQMRAWHETWAREALRVLKPGGHLLAFSGPRTYHHLASGIEEAGFEIRDSIHWVFGSGFPKSLDIGKAIDKAVGAEREIVNVIPDRWTKAGNVLNFATDREQEEVKIKSRPASLEAQQWDGWGSALKPAHEPICLARKPLAEKNLAANVLAWNCGGLNIDRSRIGDSKDGDPNRFVGVKKYSQNAYAQDQWIKEKFFSGLINSNQGRFPSNLILSHAEECEQLDPIAVPTSTHYPASRGPGDLGTSGHSGQIDLPEERPGQETVERWRCAPDCPIFRLNEQGGESTSSGTKGYRNADKFRTAYGTFKGGPIENPRDGDSGPVSRYFKAFDYEPLIYSGKATQAERTIEGTVENTHPTVKPVAVLQYLIKLITPPGGVVLDPFCGSGSTILAAQRLGFDAIGIDKEPEYVRLAIARLTADQPLFQ